MSNYYHRDKDGNWFVSYKKNGKTKRKRVEFSDSMEIAYKMGRIAEIDRFRGEMNENLMQVRYSQVWGIQDAPVSR